jgi:predicted acyltransferase
MTTPAVTQPEPIAAPVRAISAPPGRLASIDAYRGLVMLLMMGEVLRLRRVAQALPGNRFWDFLASQQTHVEWVGASLHDLIQPSFSFLVGVALPFSIASRAGRGDSPGRMTLHAAWRALVLILLGVFLRSIGRPITNWTFEDTLTQIGMGYVLLFALGFRPNRDAWSAFAALLIVTWTAFALWPLPAADFDYARVGVPRDWLATHGLAGFAAHWQKNSNVAWAFDTWWLNLFSREKPFLFNAGGYATLSFVPTLATMILGLIAGRVLRSGRDATAKLRWLAIAGLAGILAGLLLGWLGLCPVVKRIWTPAWTLWSGGVCFLFLAGFYWFLDMGRRRGWAYPLIVVGANSIAAYLMAHLFQDFITKALLTNLGAAPFKVAGAAYQPLLLGAATLLVMWAMLWWMYRKKIFLKI